MLDHVLRRATAPLALPFHSRAEWTALTLVLVRYDQGDVCRPVGVAHLQ